MIPRYTRPEMAAIWDPQTRFRIWFEIEAHASDAMAELDIIPKEAAWTIWEKAKNAKFDVARIDEIERETKHDVIAFLTHLAEIVGPEARGRHLDCGRREIARSAQASRLRAQDDADDRPLARHSCRAGDIRAQARAGLCGVF